jgi:hypothetical protein
MCHKRTFQRDLALIGAQPWRNHGRANRQPRIVRQDDGGLLPYPSDILLRQCLDLPDTMRATAGRVCYVPEPQCELKLGKYHRVSNHRPEQESP